MGFRNSFWSRFPKTMSVDERRTKALKAAEKLGRKQDLDPVVIDGALALTWWGQAWNQNLESYADYSNRLPRGRSYARHGSVIDLRIEPGSVAALVQGSQAQPYEVKISITAMDANARAHLTQACAGKLDSTEALLSGRFPEDMVQLLTAAKTGLFPSPGGIRFSCSCPDSARLCKHVAATLYGVGSRLDRDAAHFFRLRKIELEDLVSHAVQGETQRLLQAKGSGESARMKEADGDLAALFGIELGVVGEKPLPAVIGVEGETTRPNSEQNFAKALAKEAADPKRAKRIGRNPKERTHRDAGLNQKAISAALVAVEILLEGISELEIELESLLE